MMRAKRPEEWYDSVDWLYGGQANNAGEIPVTRRLR